MWICKKCNEELEDEFDSCWNCSDISEEELVLDNLKEEKKIRKQEVKTISNNILALILAFVSVFFVSYMIFSSSGEMPHVMVVCVMLVAAYGGFKAGFENKNKEQ